MRGMGWAVAVVLLWSLAAAAQQEKPVPIEQEPRHHVVLENEYVRVLHTKIPAGDTSLFHIHAYDQVTVVLATSTITDQVPGGTMSEQKTNHAGDVTAETLTQPKIHRVRNVGATILDTMVVQLLKKPGESPSMAIAPVAAENPEARVYRWKLAAGASSPMHTHTRPYLILTVTPMKLKMAGPDGQSRSEEVKAGDFHWVDFKVAHTLMNEGASDGEIVEIELK